MDTAITEVDPSALPPSSPTGGEERVVLGRYSVPLRWALNWGRGDCRECSGKGWIERVDQRGVRVLCHRCVIPRATRALNAQVQRADAHQVPLDPPHPALDAKELERHERKVTSLRRQLNDLEDRLTRHGVRHATAVDDQRRAVGALVISEQELSSLVLAQTVRAENARAAVKDTEEILVRHREAQVGAEAKLSALRVEHEAVAMKRAAGEGPLLRAEERLARDTAGLRKEIERARRRLNMALAWVKAGGGEGDVNGGLGAGCAGPAGDQSSRPDPAGASREVAP